MMKHEYVGAIVEKEFEYKGYPCIILMMASGYKCGYVGLPKIHPLYGKHFNDLRIVCHGCITYSRNNLFGYDGIDKWWIGFDTGHYGDGYDFETAIELFKEYPKNIQQLEYQKMLEEMYPTFNKFADLEYCENQCRDIVDQIIKEKLKWIKLGRKRNKNGIMQKLKEGKK